MIYLIFWRIGHIQNSKHGRKEGWMTENSKHLKAVPGSVIAVVGGQFGSEGKGQVAAGIAKRFEVHIRTGAPNAGHTFYDDMGSKVVARSLPCGWLNPNAKLVIGPGALLDPALLRDEVSAVEAMGYEIRSRLYVDLSAGIIDEDNHHHFEGGVDGQAHEIIGSTGEGVGPARMAKIARKTISGRVFQMDLVGDKLSRFAWLPPANVTHTADLANKWIDEGDRVLLEGTQGSGLSLTHGPEWPYCTSTDTNSAQLASDAGISPSLIDRTILVCRTFPIRVAGNSGPLPNETAWEEVGVPPEQTTVTKKVRRVGRWDDAVVRKAIALNRPVVLAITFLDYLFPEVAGAKTTDEITARAWHWIKDMELRMDAPIGFICTGPNSMIRRAPWGLTLA